MATRSTRRIAAPPSGVYHHALLDPVAVQEWMSLTAYEPGPGRFVKLVPHRVIVQIAVFESDDPAMTGEMTIAYLLAEDDAGTVLTAQHDDLPPELSTTDNELGWRMSMDKPARLIERP